MTLSKSDTIAVIRSLLSSTNMSYNVFNLNKDFKNVTGVDIPLFGYGNISDFLSSIPDTVKITGIYPIQKVSLVCNEKSAHIVSLVNRQRKNEVKKNFPAKRKPLAKWAIDFRSKEFWESRIVIEKDPEVLKDESSPCIDNSISLGNSSQNEGSIPVINVKDHTQVGEYVEICPPCIDNSISLRNFSQIEESIPVINVKDHAQVGEYVEVCPCWIYSPDKFYFRFRKFKKKFSNFNNKLQSFYEEMDEQIPCLGDDIKPKQSCVVFHNISSRPMWHRAEIQKINNSSQVTVNFVDYGSSMEVLKENVKYLDKSFHSFPQQAILGSLANIKPLNNNSKWSHKSITRFHDLAFGKDLVGGVVYINDDGCLGMALSKTGDHEIHINDTLVNEGYAQFNINVLENSYGEDLTKKNLYNSVLEPKIKENIRNPIYFSSKYECNNMKLQKMFSD